MLKRIQTIESTSYEPNHNLALESWLLAACPEDACILYLWQNQNTVVIGQNQNAWKECNITKLEQAGGHLVRRLSGGGAVFHDLGNLNFTFVTHKKHYDLVKQTEVIIKGMENLGLKAEKSGRNDILIDGRKFSGNAYYESQGHCYHHGTIMVDVNTAALGDYLNVSPDKLKSKGVSSVRSRVVNLRELLPDLTINQVKEALWQAFKSVYDLPVEALTEASLNQAEVDALYQKFSSWDWIFGKKIEFTNTLYERFPWGSMEWQLKVSGGVITEALLYSDSLRPDFIEDVRSLLVDVPYSNQAMAGAFGSYQTEDEQLQAMRDDVVAWLEKIEL